VIVPWVSLIGFMCSGKSATGRALARQLGWEHFDTDALIMERTGMEVVEIFETLGEPAFRRMEHEVVEGLPPERDLVLSTGGGLVLNERTMEILVVQGPVFWLRVEHPDVLERAQRPWAAKRPLLAGPDLSERIERLMAERNPLYQRYGMPVPGGFAHPRAAARHILDLLGRREDFQPYFGRTDEPDES
jgi:shikimate kinase